MTVGELIQELAKFSPDMRVRLDIFADDRGSHLYDIESFDAFRDEVWIVSEDK